MKVLLISDVESEVLLKYYKENHFDNIDLILSAGDLSNDYLHIIKTNLNAPLFYVRGNHDKFKIKLLDRELIEWKCIDYNGIKIAGIGCLGKNGKIYSEKQMEAKLEKLCKKIDKKGGADVVISHYPAQGFGSGADAEHSGFRAIKDFIDESAPKYFFYGHNHLNYGRNERKIIKGKTTFINAYEKYIVEI
jgi:Icc-related predicted phosphoesterase